MEAVHRLYKNGETNFEQIIFLYPAAGIVPGSRLSPNILLKKFWR